MSKNAQSSSELMTLLNKARIVGTPLVTIATPDPQATVSALRANFKEGARAEVPLMVWDLASGVQALNEAAVKNLNKADQMDIGHGQGNIVDAFEGAERLPAKSCLILHNAHWHLDSPMAVQWLWNLRDEFKSNGRTLILLGPSFVMPTELKNDVLPLEERLPNAEEVAVIVRKQYAATRAENPGVPELTEEMLTKAVDASIGLTAFAVEQAVALSLTLKGVDFDALWKRKTAAIEQQRGLSIWRGRERFEDIAGCENVKGYMARLIEKTKKPIRTVLWFDEIEKMFAGLGNSSMAGDSNGINSDRLAQMLKWMEDSKAKAVLLVGFPGTGKSLVAKATGTQAGCPTVEVDLGAMSGRFVGESEGYIRAFIQIVDTMAPDGALIVATCNDVSNLPPEFLSRFRRGQFFFDLPTREEREEAWRIHIAAQGLDADHKNTGVEDNHWGGREIESACGIAAELELSLPEAARLVVPTYKTMGDKATRLRETASGRFIDAAKPGVWENGSGSSKVLPIKGNEGREIGKLN